MGLSSNARLLTLTSRIRSNEYHTQRISNAKLRLASESQEASMDYIKALNTQKMVYSTYDTANSPVDETLTTNVLYTYGDMKNQYILSNVVGQALVTKIDAENFEKSETLDDFLSAYGMKKHFKTSEMEEAYNKLNSTEYRDYKRNYENKKNEVLNLKGNDLKKLVYRPYDPWNICDPYPSDPDSVDWPRYDNAIAARAGFNSYQELKENFYKNVDAGYTFTDVYNDNRYYAYEGFKYCTEVYNDYLEDPDKINRDYTNVNDSVIDSAIRTLKNNYQHAIADQDTYATLDSYVDNYISKYETEVYEDMQKYKEMLAAFDIASEDFGDNPVNWYDYGDDTAKAQWYTNLWYRLNGESTVKSKDGIAQANYQVLDGRLLDSDSWIRDAIAQGVVSIEEAKIDTNESLDIPDKELPTVFRLKGISWNTKMLSNCADIKGVDDNAAITKAEAEYQKRTQEINAKDQKLTNQMRKLDSERESLTKSYEQAKNTVKQNIERSFTAFS